MKEKQLETILETNNNEQQGDSVKQKVAEVLDVKINNKEKGNKYVTKKKIHVESIC